MRVHHGELIKFLNSHDLPLIVGKNAEFYRSSWLECAAKAHRGSFNPNIYTLSGAGFLWQAFILLPAWHVYRGLYLHGAMLFAVFLLLPWLDGLLFAPLSLMLVLGVGIFSLFKSGLWYLQRCFNLYRRGQTLPDEAARAALYRKKGGTRLVFALMCGFAFVALTYLSSNYALLWRIHMILQNP